jgi:amino acid transporter
MTELRKVLNYRVVLLITINAIIGSGLFFLPSIGARYSGPASIISWIIVSLVTIYTAACFSELVSMFPKAGGVYEFNKRAFGRFFSFMIGWMAWLVGNITTAMLIVGAIQYLLPFNNLTFTIVKIFISLTWVFIFNLMAYKGIKTSAVMLISFAVITLTIILILILPSIPKISLVNLSPFFIHNDFFSNLSSIFVAIFFISQAFFGLESVCFLAEEVKHPEKYLPKSLMNGVFIISALSLLLVFTSLSIIHWKVFGLSGAPFSDLAYILMGDIGRDIITIGTYLVIIGAAAGWIVTGPRLILALTRDKLFLPQFKAIHHKYHTPYKAIIFQGIVTAIFVLMSFKGKGYETLLAMLIPLVLFMMSATVLAVPILRKKKPILARPFKVFFGRSGPILIILFNLSLITLWIWSEPNAINLLMIASSFVFLGIPIYLLIEFYYNPKMIHKVDDLFAYVSLLFENFSIPKRVKENLFFLLGDIENKKILDFGCSVGTLTVPLAEKVGKGKVYGVDISEHDINITYKRLSSKNLNNFKLIYDPSDISRIHPSIPKVNGIISANMIGYIQRPIKVLKGMNRLLKVNEKVCFSEYDKFFGFIPNKEWLTRDRIILSHFHEAGFEVDIIRKKALFWQYIYIYGKKSKEV